MNCTDEGHFSHQHHHRRASSECSVYMKKEAPCKLRCLLTEPLVSLSTQDQSLQETWGTDAQVPHYMLALHVAEPLSRGIPYRSRMLWNLLRAILSVKTYHVLVLSCSPDRLLSTSQLFCMGLLPALFGSLEFTFQAPGRLGTREEEET